MKNFGVNSELEFILSLETKSLGCFFAFNNTHLLVIFIFYFSSMGFRNKCPPKSCDTFVALPPATIDNLIIFGKNSDRPSDEVQEVVFFSAATYQPGDKVEVRVSYPIHFGFSIRSMTK